MSNSKTPEPQSEPLYILKQPYKLPNGDKWIDVSWEDFDELFKPFDGELLKQQIAEQAATFTRRLLTDSKPWNELTNAELQYMFAAEVLELIYPTKENE